MQEYENKIRTDVLYHLKKAKLEQFYETRNCQKVFDDKKRENEKKKSFWLFTSKE